MIEETRHKECVIILVRGDGYIMIVPFTELLPLAFGPRNLGIDPMDYGMD